MKVLLKAGADVQWRDADNATTVFKAVESKNIVLIEELISNGADINHLNRVRNNSYSFH